MTFGSFSAYYPWIAGKILIMKIQNSRLAVIGFFHEYDEYGCFSNSYSAAFDYAGRHYTSAEQFMMYHRAMTFDQQELAEEIMNSDDPAVHKKLGQSDFSAFDAELWDKISCHIVKRGVKAKFRQNPEILEILLDTGDAILAECSPHDAVWGIGCSLKDLHDPSCWKGKNCLGRILMEVREELYREMLLSADDVLTYHDVMEAEIIPEWNMKASELAIIPQYDHAIHAYSDTLKGNDTADRFLYQKSLREWEKQIRSGDSDIRVSGFFEMKQDIYDTARLLSLTLNG